MRWLVLFLLVLIAPSPAAADDAAVWELLRGGGQVVLMRHAVTTPGVGDPTSFRLNDCTTQRNLTDAGRADAKRVRAVFQSRAIPVGRVLSSPWCRCLETARLAFGRAEVWPPLSNLFDNSARETEQMRALKEIAGRRPTGGNLLLVTHGSIVLPLTGIQPAPAELVVLTPEVQGRGAPHAVTPGTSADRPLASDAEAGSPQNHLAISSPSAAGFIATGPS
jgi:phosphohistidine phosphatase SixA